jgi:hypothetical protein
MTYALATPLAFAAGGAPGGDYTDNLVTSYIGSDHWVLAWLYCYLGAAGAVGLLIFGLRWHSSTGSSGDTLRGLTLAAAAVSVVGWFVDGGVVVSMAEGGRAVQSGVPHPVVYTLTETGNLLAVCAPAFFMGIGAILLATRSPMPRWLKVFSVVAGLCGILAPLFFTYGLYVLWTVVFAGWLLAGGRRAAPTAAASREASLV